MTIATMDELRDRRFSRLPNGHTRWVPIRELWPEMTPDLRRECGAAFYQVAVHQTRRTVTVATRKYRARKGCRKREA